MRPLLWFAAVMLCLGSCSRAQMRRHVREFDKNVKGAADTVREDGKRVLKK